MFADRAIGVRSATEAAGAAQRLRYSTERRRSGRRLAGARSVETILTWDVGTTSVKVTLWAVDGVVVGQAGGEYPTDYPAPGQAEQDSQAWWDAAVTATRDLRDRVAESSWRSIAAVGLTSARESVVPLARDGSAMRPCILWFDRRSSAEAIELAEWAGGPGALQQRTGVTADAGFTATKLLWLARHDAEVLDAWKFMQPRDFMYYQLTGVPVTDPSLASRTMLWDIAAGTFDAGLCERVGVRLDQFPDVRPSASAPAGLSAAVARLLGLPAGLPVAVGGGDRQCEALGAGVTDDRAMESSGTTTNVSVALTPLPPHLDSRVNYSMSVLPGVVLAEQGMTTTGALLDWVRRMTFAGSDQDLETAFAEAERSGPGARGLLVLPFFMGAKATRWDPFARGAVIGLTLAHERGDLLRAAMEGIAFEVRACIAVLAATHAAPGEVVLMGGGNRSDVWAQVKADVLGQALGRLRHGEAAGFGAMLLAAAAVGLCDDPVAWARRLNPVERLFEPGADAGRYQALAALYERAWEDTVDVVHQLAGDPGQA